MSYLDFRTKPLEKGKMSIKQLRKKIKKAKGVWELDCIESFLTQFSKLELRWLYSSIKYLDEKYDVGVI